MKIRVLGPTLALSLATAFALSTLVATTPTSALPPKGGAPSIPVAALKKCKVLHPSECKPLETLQKGGEKGQATATAMLSHEDPWIRRAGARLLARAPSKEAAGLLVRLLDDPNPDLRSDALDALGMSGEPLHARAVVALLAHETTPAVRVAAVRALGRLGSPEGVAPLLTALDGDDPHAALAAARGLGALRDAAAVVPLATVLADPRKTADLQAESARSLARLEDARAIPNLMLATGSPHVEVRRQAILTLGILNAKQAADVLIEHLSDDAVLREAVLALGNIDDPATLEPLLTVMRIKEIPVEVRQAVVQALARRKVADAVPELMAMLREVDGPLAVDVIRALGAIRDERAIARLIDMLTAKDPAVVGAANSALQQITGKRFDPNPDYWNQWLTERDTAPGETEVP